MTATVPSAAIPSAGSEFDVLTQRWLEWKPVNVPLTGASRGLLLVALPIIGVVGGVTGFVVLTAAAPMGVGSGVARGLLALVIVASVFAIVAGLPGRLLPMVHTVFAVSSEVLFWLGLALATTSELLLSFCTWWSFRTGWSSSEATVLVVFSAAFTVAGFCIASGATPPLVTRRWRVRLASATASVIPWVVLLLTGAVTVLAIVAEETRGRGNDLVTSAAVAVGVASFGLAPALHRARVRRAVVFEDAFTQLIAASTSPGGDHPLHDPTALRVALLRLESLLLTRRWPPRRAEVPEAAGEVMVYLVTRLLWPDAQWRRPRVRAQFDGWVAGRTEADLVAMLRHGCVSARLGVLGQRVSKEPFDTR